MFSCVASIGGSTDSGCQRDQATNSLKPSGPQSLTGDLDLRTRSISTPRLLYQIVCIQVILFELLATSVGLARALGLIRNGRESSWLALAVAEVIWFRTGLLISKSVQGRRFRPSPQTY